MLKIWIILTAVFASEVLTTPVKKCRFIVTIKFTVPLFICLTNSFIQLILKFRLFVGKLDKELPFPLSVEVEGCDKPPCKIVKGTKISMHIKFTNGMLTEHKILK